MKRKLAILLVHLSAIGASAQQPACPADSAIAITRGFFEPELGVRYELNDFHARLVSKGRTPPLCYERTTLVSKAEIFISSESLTKVFSRKLQTAHSKIRDFAVRHDAEGATLTGSVTKLIPVHFTIKGLVSTDGSLIRLDVKSVKADGLPIKELLKIVGAELNSLLPVRGLRGIEIGDDYLSFSPEAVANLKGHITSVSTSTQGLTLRYGPVHNRSKR